MSYTLEFPIQYFPSPLEFGATGLGNLYVGVVDGDPAATPSDRIQVYISRQGASDLAISQPVAISSGGVPYYNGSPVTLKISAAYSIAVTDFLGQQVYYSPKAGEEIQDLADLSDKVDALELKQLIRVDVFSDFNALTVSVGDKIYLGQHTSLGIGGGDFIAVSSAGLAADGGVVSATASTGVYVKRINFNDITPAMFGCTEGGSLDCTVAMQKAWDYSAKNKCFLDGLGFTYKVYTISALSGQRVKNLTLESLGPLTGGAISLQPVVLIDGTTVKKENMIFENVRVNGRRDLFNNISFGSGEDGGCHAWRCIASDSGGIDGILWNNCWGINSATAGIAWHCPTPSTTTANYPIKNIQWIGGRLTGNREHGWFADSFNGLLVSDVDCRFNGLDLNTSDALTHGNRGARAGGFLFGASFDVESYGPNFVGSLWLNLTIRNLDCRASAMPALFYNPIAVNVSGYLSHENIKVEGCTFDKGSASGADRAPNTDYSFYAIGTAVGATYPYNGLMMSNNYFQGAPPEFIGVKGLSVSGGYISSTVKARISDCLYYDVSCAGGSSSITISPTVNPVFTKTQGSVAASIAVQNTIRKTSISGAGIKYHIEMRVTGAAAADGDLIYTTVSPIAGMIMTEIDVSARSPIGAAVAAASSVDVIGNCTITLDTSASTDIYFRVVLSLFPAM